MNTLVSFIIVLGVLIFVHELGHFLFAKLFRVKVLVFSLGFGPKVLSRVIGETEYRLSALPLGGYVKMFGEQEDEPRDAQEDEKRSFAHKPVWNRFLIILAGPLFNFLFCIFLFFFIYLVMGLPQDQDTTTIGVVNENSPAFAAGLEPGDTIIAIDGIAVSGWLDVLNLVKNSEGEELIFAVDRAGEQRRFAVVPAMDEVRSIFGEELEQRYMIGVMKQEVMVLQRVGLFEAFQQALVQTWMFIYLTVMAVIKLVQGVVPASELGGPILIAQMAGETAQAGWLNFCYFMGLVSVNLGILNLLPIPVLDGGHLVFLTLEGLRGKPLNERVQIAAQQVGIALLGTLMIFVFYNDIVRLFSP
ncbi:MAG: RIP metalloprotease RseP [Desulfofustis sp. PB-SRB1]|jgi:regulator of sigma E protease|nr:RIP metalloprotease RseP [Desulfofustis sp. PB-SRB1]MBM1003816.1 RIP metalloprotease RseP [Desulfofustis sp. PB-SRB1]HBH30039.1 RIP metalloprotease RseP [Desulfofustis sp.]HBH31859.1 RIP metalloprotease RseP [Desulfofustis sp.]